MAFVQGIEVMKPDPALLFGLTRTKRGWRWDW